MPLTTGGLASFPLHPEIPDYAVEVLLFVEIVQFENLVAEPTYSRVRIYTSEGIRQYNKYIVVYTPTTSIHNADSDNLWLPVTSNRIVHVSVDHAHGPNIIGDLFAAGYR